jgi:hypothetical protein
MCEQNILHWIPDRWLTGLNFLKSQSIKRPTIKAVPSVALLKLTSLDECLKNSIAK